MIDSKGRESRTLKFVSIAFSLISAAFALSWIDGDGIPLGEYGAAVGMILAPWVGREWVKRDVD